MALCVVFQYKTKRDRKSVSTTYIQFVYFMLYPLRDNNFIIFYRGYPFSSANNFFRIANVHDIHSIAFTIDDSVARCCFCCYRCCSSSFAILFALNPPPPPPFFCFHSQWIFIICMLWYVSHEIVPFQITLNQNVLVPIHTHIHTSMIFSPNDNITDSIKMSFGLAIAS